MTATSTRWLKYVCMRRGPATKAAWQTTDTEVSRRAACTAKIFWPACTSGMAFAQQVYGYGRPGDVLRGISASGNARTVLHALQVARVLHLRTIGLTGGDGGALPVLRDVVVRVPRDGTVAIQEGHLPIYHALYIMREEALFDT